MSDIRETSCLLSKAGNRSILSAFIRNLHFCRGPLDGISPTNTSGVHTRLLAYYRILVACPHVSTLFQWSHETLLQTLSLPNVGNGIRWLLVRCYALHTGMSEAQRDELQLSVLGPPGEADVAIEAGRSIDGSLQWLDGWLLPVLEVWRVREHRHAMLHEHEFYREDDCQPTLRINLEQLTFVSRSVVGMDIDTDVGFSDLVSLISMASSY